MKLRALFALPIVLGVLPLAQEGVASAQIMVRPDEDDDEPAGSVATPPESPKDVPPPASPPPVADTKGRGTTSAGYVQGDDELEHAGTDGGGRKRASGLVYRRGRYMLRDDVGLFELSPSALLQFDTYGFAGSGVPDYQRADGSGLKMNFAARRTRLELVGRVLQKWYFVLGMESASGAPFQPLNDYIGVELSRMFRVQVGQMRIPFTMDNVTSVRWLDFMERSLTTRVLGAPLTRDLGAMVWGGTEKSAVWYALGWFGGEGQNRPSTDNRGDLVARMVFRPLWAQPGEIKAFHVGFSGRWGRRDRNYVQYDAPAMSTPGGYTFWSPVYGTGAGRTHVRPSNDQSAVAAEVFIPGCCFDLRAEVVGVRDGRREVLESSTDNNTERAGTLTAWSYYVQATFWPYGPPRPNGPPGNYGALADPPHPRARALAIALRWEQLFAKYDSIDRSNDANGNLIAGVTRGGLDQKTTNIRVNALQLAASYWATRHVRVLAEWSMYMFPGGSSDNQAVAPGVRANGNDADARTFHEISGRVQVAF